MLRLIQKILEDLGSGWMAKLAKCFCLDLAHAFAGNVKFLAHFLERMGTAILQAEAQGHGHPPGRSAGG